MLIVKILALLTISLTLFSCETTKSQVKKQDVPTTFEQPYAKYPMFRIEKNINKICILGVGSGSEQTDVDSELTNYFMKHQNIKVVDPSNINSFLAGKIIEYKTGLTQAQSQALSRMLQVDHIVLFEQKFSPYTDYMQGGRAYSQINVKIINTLGGEIIFQSSCNLGIRYANPRNFGYSSIKQLSTSIKSNITRACLGSIMFELSYGLGASPLGFASDSSNIPVVKNILKNSPSDKAGLRKDDVIVGINENKINNKSDYIQNINDIKQGDSVNIKVDRDGRIYESSIVIPIIPDNPRKKESEPTRKEKVRESQT